MSTNINKPRLEPLVQSLKRNLTKAGWDLLSAWIMRHGQRSDSDIDLWFYAMYFTAQLGTGLRATFIMRKQAITRQANCKRDQIKLLLNIPTLKP